MARVGICAALVGMALVWPHSARGCGYVDETPPPTLDYFLHRLPAKSFGNIVGKPANGGAVPPNISDALDDLAKMFGHGTPDDHVKEVDAYLTKARAGGSPDTDLNMLESIRDAAASNASALELQNFLAWRRQNDAWFTTGTAITGNMGELNDKISIASPALKPCWLYLMGAVNFRAGYMDEAEGFFDQVLTGYKDAPCAEMALFMKARCWRSRASSDRPQKTDGDSARKWFRQYLAQYPNGRFAADAWGWLGGLESDEALALVDFARQAESTDHPEVFASAENEVERIFENLDYNEGDPGFDEVAQHPELALAVTYVIVNATTIQPPRGEDDWPPSPEDQSKLEKWRGTALPKLAAAVLAHKDLYRSAEGQDRYLTILAHAASDNGDQQKALGLIAMAQKDGAPSDDFLFVKALVLQRAAKLEDAVKTYRQLGDSFPQSALLPGARYRLALALHDLGREGDALLELAALNHNKLPIYYPDNSQGIILPAATPNLYRTNSNADYYGVPSQTGAESQQIIQTVQTILNFAPINSLASPLQATDPDHEIFRQQLREIVVTRCLANNDFKSAAHFTDDPALKKEFTDKATEADALLAVNVNTPRNAAPVNLPRAALATEAMDLADYWTTHRFKLTWVPLQAQVSNTDFKKEDSDEFRRVQNGALLHYPPGDVNRELDSRDELAHALDWWRKADAFDPQGAIAPQALWKIIQARRLIAQETPYALQRAADTNMAEDVRRDYDRLMHAYPDSIEARQYAVYWSVPNASDLAAAYSRWDLMKKYQGYAPAVAHFGHPAWFAALQIPFEDDEEAKSPEWQAVCNEVAALPDSSGNDTSAQFAARVNALLARAHPLALINNRASEINCLDDLADLATVPNLDPVIRTEYVKTRLNAMLDENSQTEANGYPGYDMGKSDRGKYPVTVDLKNDSRAQPIADFIDGLDVRDLTGAAKLSPEDFLKKYPTSVKREMAAFYRIRFALAHNQPNPGDAASSSALDDAFRDYDREFLHGKLSRGVLWMHGKTEMLRKHWGPAAHYFSLILEQKESPELKQDSAFQIATIFDQLNDDNLRHEVLQEILQDADARAYLKQYADCGELPFLKFYVLAQVAGG